MKTDLWLAAAIAVAIAAGYLREYLIVYVSIIMHEIGHIASARFTGTGTHEVYVAPFGLRAEMRAFPAERYKRLLIYLSGPLTNILLILPAFVFNKAGMNYYIRFFIFNNICLAMFNMLPVLPLDGGRVLRELLWGWFGYFYTRRFMKHMALILSAAAILTGGLQLAGGHFNFSLILIGFYLMICYNSNTLEEAAMVIRNIMFRRSRILKKGIYAARELAVLKSVTLGETIKNMDYDRFHLIYVLDEQLRLIRVFTEQEVMDAVLVYGNFIDFGELICKA